MKSVQALCGKSHCRIKAECNYRLVEVIVNRFGHADHSQALLCQYTRNGERPITPNRDQRVNLMELKRANQFIRPIDLPDAASVILDGIMQGVVAIGCPDNGPAEVRYPAHPVAREPDQSAVDVLLRK